MERASVGDTVKLNEIGRAASPPKKQKDAGQIIGFSRDTRNIARVSWQGYAMPEEIHVSYLDPISHDEFMSKVDERWRESETTERRVRIINAAFAMTETLEVSWDKHQDAAVALVEEFLRETIGA